MLLPVVGVMPGYPNPFIELRIYTHLHERGAAGTAPLSRNHINVLSSDVIVLLPGGEGTLAEANLAIAYGRPVLAHLASRAELPGLPPSVPCEGDFERFTARLRAWLRAVRAARDSTGG